MLIYITKYTLNCIHYIGVKTSLTTPHLSGENTHADWQIEDAADVSILKQKENNNLRYSRQCLSELNTSTQSIYNGEMLMSDEEDCNSNYMQHSNSMRGMTIGKNCFSPGHASSKYVHVYTFYETVTFIYLLDF